MRPKSSRIAQASSLLILVARIALQSPFNTMPWPTPERLLLDPTLTPGPTRETDLPIIRHLPKAAATKLHPSNALGVNATLMFIGTATTILEWEGIRLMTDPNFLHKGDKVQKGLGATTTRLTDPAIDLYDLPRIDVVLVSHYHE
jgi:hypothetical protein